MRKVVFVFMVKHKSKDKSLKNHYCLNYFKKIQTLGKLIITNVSFKPLVNGNIAIFGTKYNKMDNTCHPPAIFHRALFIWQ